MKNRPALPARMRLLWAAFWRPTPLPRPSVLPELRRLPTIQRCAAVLRYAFLRLEYWISPGGGLRQWARFNIGLVLLIGIPALFVVPFIAFLLAQLASWTGSLVLIAQNLLLLLGLALAAVATITALLGLLRGRRK